MSEAIIDTRDAGYQQIDARRLTLQHVVIDVTGGEHALHSIRPLKKHTKVTRQDGWVDWFEHGEVVTVLPVSETSRQERASSPQA